MKLEGKVAIVTGAGRGLDGLLGLTEMAPIYLQETRGGRNIQHELVPLLRQSVKEYGKY